MNTALMSIAFVVIVLNPRTGFSAKTLVLLPPGVQGPHPPIAVGECWAYLTNLQYARPEERIIALDANWSGVVSTTAPLLRRECPEMVA